MLVVLVGKGGIWSTRIETETFEKVNWMCQMKNETCDIKIMLEGCALLYS